MAEEIVEGRAGSVPEPPEAEESLEGDASVVGEEEVPGVS